MEPDYHEDTDYDEESFQRAAAKNESALKFLAAGKLREALDFLNQAIAAAPAYPDSYANRAEVFERMGLFPQAEADRHRAHNLGHAPAFEEIPEARSSFAGTPPAPPRSARSLPRLQVPSGLLMATAAVVLLAGATFALTLALFALIDDESDLSTGTDTTRESPAAGNTLITTPTSAASPDAATTGAPFSFSSLQSAWQSKGIAAALGAPSEGFTGFSIAPLDVTLSRGAGTGQLSVFIYRSREAPAQDWDLVVGSRPAAKSGRTIPAHATIWWNTNIIVVVRSADSDISADALDAFLNLGS